MERKIKPFSPLRTAHSVRSYGAPAGSDPADISLKMLLSALSAHMRDNTEKAVRESCAAIPAGGKQETIR